MQNHYAEYKELKQCYKSIILQKQTDQLIEKETRFVATRGGEEGEGELDEGRQNIQTFSYKISTRDVMYNMIKISNTAVCYK